MRFGLPESEVIPGAVRTVDRDEEVVVFWHNCTIAHSNFNPVPARLPLNPERWQVVQDEPLSIQPSIKCSECGLHGFWTNGEWVSA